MSDNKTISREKVENLEKYIDLLKDIMNTYGSSENYKNFWQEVCHSNGNVNTGGFRFSCMQGKNILPVLYRKMKMSEQNNEITQCAVKASKESTDSCILVSAEDDNHKKIQFVIECPYANDPEICYLHGKIKNGSFPEI